MVRRAPDNRFQQLIEAATAVFISHGYSRTQMADVAAAAGVAKGTLYLYVESKEALFDLALRHADVATPYAAPANLPVRTPPSGRTARYVRERMAATPASPTLHAALARRGAHRSPDELSTILRELYRTMASNRTGIKLVDRCAADYPELARAWFSEGREALLRQLAKYVELGIVRRWFRAVADVDVAARLLLETVVFWAVHRHWDPSPQRFDPRGAEETIVQMLVRSLAAESQT